MLYPINKNIVEIVSVDDVTYTYVTSDGEVITKKLDVITKPILHGKYSQIPKAYIENNFSPLDNSLIFMIVNKDYHLKYFLETVLDTDISDDLELWSRLDTECYK